MVSNFTRAVLYRHQGKPLPWKGFQALELAAPGNGGVTICGGVNEKCILLLDTWFNGGPGSVGLRVELHDHTGPFQQAYDGVIP